MHSPPLTPAPDAPILSVRHLTKRFGDVTAVNDLSLEIAPGESLGLLGVNGAGKTTAMNMILGLVEPDGGRIEVFGQDLRRHRIPILRRVNYSSSYTSLPGNLRVWQNLHVFARIYGVRNPHETIDRLLELFEIPDLRNRVTAHLSSGESTRVNLCKALLNDPELLLLDEPTASLDPDIADKVRGIIRRVQTERRIAILYTSHNMRDVEEICDRVIFVHEGRVFLDGRPSEVTRRFREESLEGLFIRIARDHESLEPGRS